MLPYATFCAAIVAHGAGGLGAVKRALPSADYAHIKLVAAMMNTQQHWFAPGGADGGAGMHGGAVTAGENNGAAANGRAQVGEPGAKRQRTSSGSMDESAAAAAAAQAAGLTAEELAGFDDWD